MAFVDVVRQMTPLWRKHDYAAIRELLVQFLQTASGIERGQALGQLALCEYKDDIYKVPHSLALIENALSNLRHAPLERALVLLDGLLMSRMAGDVDRARSYADQLHAIIEIGACNRALHPWLGRFWLALGRHEEEFGNLEIALKYCRVAVAFCDAFLGPFDQDDTYCYQAMARKDICGILIKLDRIEDAEMMFAELQTVPVVAGSTGLIEYVGAYLALVKGATTICDTYLRILESDPKLTFEHGLYFKVAEMRAKYYNLLGDSRSAIETIEPIVVRAAGVGNASLVLRLQRLVDRLVA